MMVMLPAAVDCAHPFLSLLIFFCHHHHMECLLFSDLRTFSLSFPLCEWFSSTPFLSLVYYLFFCWISCSCTGLVSRDKIPQVITRFYLSPHSPPTFEVMLTRFGSLISPYVPLGHQSGSALWQQLCNIWAS